MNIKQAISIFLSIFNLSIDSDVKDESAFEYINIVDYNGDNVGVLYKSNTSNQYIINIKSPELGVGVGYLTLKENGYDLLCSFNTQMLHSQNRIYDNITNRMSISLGEKVGINNTFTAFKKRKIVMMYSGSNETKDINLLMGNSSMSFREDDIKYRLETKNSSFEVEVEGYKEDRGVCYEYTSTNSSNRNWGGYSAISDLTAIENMLCFFPCIGEGFRIDFNIIEKVRKASKQTPSLNYFDNIFSLLLSSSTNYDKGDINALFKYVPHSLPSTPKIISGMDVLYPGGKKPANHI
jgi:hypothetical protein